MIKSEQSKLKLFSTRRGGGLPFFFQAIISTELIKNGKKSLIKTMDILLNLAQSENEDTNFCKVFTKNFKLILEIRIYYYNLIKVLSMYVLSALFKDTRIGEEVLQYAEQALIVAINGSHNIFILIFLFYLI